MINKDIIKIWGVPDILLNRHIEFIFDNKDLDTKMNNNLLVKGLICDTKGSKFCLIDKDNNNIILVMDFIILGGENSYFKNSSKITLNCLCVADYDMRNKGIAKYYLEKLINFAINNNIKKFYLYPNPDDEIFIDLNKTNILTKNNLKKFYIQAFEKFNYKFEEEDIEWNPDVNEPGLVFNLNK